MSFFPEETMQRIRFLHFKIKHIEEALKKEEESFSLDDLNLILEYTMILNINYGSENHNKILRQLDITPSYQDPTNSREIDIKDLTFECCRTLWVLGKGYSQLSEKFEEEDDWENAILSMHEASKIYKAAAYFSSAAINQVDKGIELMSDNLELESEECRIFAQGIAALREESKNNFYFASKLYSGLSALSKRLFYLKKHEEKKKQQIRAQFHVDMGRACYLKAKASEESSLTGINVEKVSKLKQKANFYYSKAKTIWETMLEELKLSDGEAENIEANLSVVNEFLEDMKIEPLDYERIKKIQDPEPIIIIPENLAPFVPKTTVYLTKYIPRDLDVKRFKSFQKKKLEKKIPYSKRERLLDKKAGVVRTINELKVLKENKEIDTDKFAELVEKYSTKLNMIDSAIEKLNK